MGRVRAVEKNPRDGRGDRSSRAHCQLTDERWSHIIEGHPYMAPFRADVMRAVQAPTQRMERPRPGQDWFYLEAAGPSR
jgi:hypothetical protein